jgi:hypothetical protein
MEVVSSTADWRDTPRELVECLQHVCHSARMKEAVPTMSHAVQVALHMPGLYVEG